MAGRFISGHDLATATPILQSRWNEGIAFSVDLLGEAVVSDAEAAAYRQHYLDLIEQLPSVVARFPANAVLDNDHLGPIPRANVSIKISALDGHVSPIDAEGSDRAALLKEHFAPPAGRPQAQYLYELRYGAPRAEGSDHSLLQTLLRNA